MGKSPYYYSENIKIYASYGETKIPYLQIEIKDKNYDYPLFVFSDIASASPEQYIRRLFDDLLRHSSFRVIMVNIGDMVEFIDNVAKAYIDYWDDLSNLPASYFC